MMTDTSDHCGEVSQLTGAMPRPDSTEFTTPESLLSIQDQVDAETISGSSQGTRNSARIRLDSGNRRWKKMASASPRLNCTAIDATVNTRVWVNAGRNVGWPITLA